MPKNTRKSQGRDDVVPSRRVIEIVSVAVFLFNVTDAALRDLPQGCLLPNRETDILLISLGACSAIILFFVQSEPLRSSLGNAAAVLPLILALGIVAGAYVIHAGFTSKAGLLHQVAFCAIGTIPLGEVWIVNESVNRHEMETGIRTAAGS